MPRRTSSARAAGKTAGPPTNGPTKKRGTFSLHAPEASQVCVAGTFNDWDPEARPLKQDKKGTWRTWTSLEPGRYEYRFVVDGEWREDPACAETCDNSFGTCNSVLRL